MLPVIIGILVTLVIALPLGFIIGIAYRKKIGEAAIGSAETEAKRIIDEAVKEGDVRRKAALVESKEEVLRARNEAEREIKERRNEVSRLEKRAIAKEESLDRKTEQLERKTEQLDRRIKDADEKNARLDEIVGQHLARLEEVAGMTSEQAKEELVSRIEDEVRHDAAARIIEIESQLKEDADEKARHILSLAIMRCASDHASEATVSVVPLPNDDMKGRIIGREGRNIRALEAATGVDVIIDDTPGAVALSGFDPIRKEVARITLERLIADGRIHPARIEEIVEKVKKEMDETIRETGKQAAFDLGIHDLHPELVRLLGRLKFRSSYGQNVLQHSKEVARLMGIMAAELKEDVQAAKRIGLLHDIGKAVDHEVEGAHATIGADIARRYGEVAEVVHAIAAHHNDVEPGTIQAVLASAGDAISAARPGARSESIEAYIKRLENLEKIALSFRGVQHAYAIQAGREIRVMVEPDKIGDAEAIQVAREVTKKIQEELEYPGQIKVVVVRETRAVEYAK